MRNIINQKIDKSKYDFCHPSWSLRGQCYEEGCMLVYEWRSCFFPCDFHTHYQSNSNMDSFLAPVLENICKIIRQFSFVFDSKHQVVRNRHFKFLWDPDFCVFIARAHFFLLCILVIYAILSVRTLSSMYFGICDVT